jgi:GntR family transcriptional regulator
VPDTPTWAKIAANLRALAAQLGPGGQMPSEAELARKHGAARETVRRAYRELEAEGLIARHRGGNERQSTVVRDVRPIELRTSRHAAAANGAIAGGPWSVAVTRAGMEPQVRLDDVDVVPLDEVPADVTKALRLDGPAVCRYRTMHADGQPAQLTTSWIPASVAGGTPLAEPVFLPGGIYQALTDAGYRPGRYTEQVRARPVTPSEAAALDLPPGAAVLDTTRITSTDDGQRLEVLRAVSDATRVRLLYGSDL